nr:hypothetical protein [Tanacetum cinerariifolium]
MCVARLATTYASITAVESKRLDELAESGANHDIVFFVVQSAINIHNPSDLMTLTTGRNKKRRSAGLMDSRSDLE